MSKSARAIIRLTALLISVVSPVIATLSYFSLWRSEGAAALLSGITVLLLTVCALPLYKLIIKHFSSPSVYTVWLVLFIIFAMLRSVAEQMTVICLVGFVSNALGAMLYKIASYGDTSDRISKKES